MKETYAMDENGDLVIIWEAETPEDQAELKEAALEAVRQVAPDKRCRRPGCRKLWPTYASEHADA